MDGAASHFRNHDSGSARDVTGEVGERYLASIYQILQRPRSAARAIL
jgi:hypothetical protein